MIAEEIIRNEIEKIETEYFDRVFPENGGHYDDYIQGVRQGLYFALGETPPMYSAPREFEFFRSKFNAKKQATPS